MSDTPRTDAKREQMHIKGHLGPFENGFNQAMREMGDHADTIERELAELIPQPCRMRENGTCELGECHQCVPRLQRELAEAVRVMESEQARAITLVEECAKLKSELAEAKKGGTGA